MLHSHLTAQTVLQSLEQRGLNSSWRHIKPMGISFSSDWRVASATWTARRASLAVITVGAFPVCTHLKVGDLSLERIATLDRQRLAGPTGFVNRVVHPLLYDIP